HAGLEVVEQRVVRVLGLWEARAELPAQLDVALQEGRERRERVPLLGLQPRAARVRGSAGHLGDQLARHAARLVELAPRGPYDVGLDVVARRGRLEQLAHPVAGEG